MSHPTIAPRIFVRAPSLARGARHRPTSPVRVGAVLGGAALAASTFLVLMPLVLALTAPARRQEPVAASAFDVAVLAGVAWMLSSLLGGFVAAVSSKSARIPVGIGHAFAAFAVASLALDLMLALVWDWLTPLRSLELGDAAALGSGAGVVAGIAVAALFATIAAVVGGIYGARRNIDPTT